jgi:hypothetical protein
LRGTSGRTDVRSLPAARIRRLIDGLLASSEDAAKGLALLRDWDHGLDVAGQNVFAPISGYFSIARGLMISLVQLMNSFATGLRSRFFNVIRPIGLRVSGNSIGSALSDPR